MGFVSQKEKHGKTELTFLSSSLTGFARWYMLFGEQAEIMEPYELNDLVKKNIQALSAKLK
jgi:predicted DNA-binding transcriptional regulator YafY